MGNTRRSAGFSLISKMAVSPATPLRSGHSAICIRSHYKWGSIHTAPADLHLSQHHYSVRICFLPCTKTICAEITEMARNSWLTWRDRVVPETIFAVDGSWSQRSNAMHCVVDFVDTCRKKVIDFEIIEKQIGFIHGNYFGPSNGMEVEDVRLLIK
jgi:hypothetical protein